MKVNCIEPKFVELIPADLMQGTLYVSMVYATTMHLCACGCGNKVVLPLSPAEWHMNFDGESVSLTPSVGNWEFPCRSHYWIRDNEIRWARAWTDQQIEAGRRRDAADLDAHFARDEAWSECANQPDGHQKPGRGLLRKMDRLIQALRWRTR